MRCLFLFLGARMLPRICCSVAVLLALAVPAPEALGAELDPAHTYAVIAGVLKWEKNKLPGFSPRHRKDQELYDVLRARGVPEKNLVLLLDEKATRNGIHQAVQTLAARAGKGSTFLFYYAGHGAMLADGSVALCNYDFTEGNPNVPPLLAKDLGVLLKKHYQGERVLLLADCCHSGGLEVSARQLGKAGFKAASLTSAQSSNLSTGNWTFTQTVIDGLRGEPLADLDGDGSVSLGELAREVAAAMKFRERQLFGFGDHGLGTDFQLSRTADKKRPAAPRGPFALREYVLVRDVGRARPARVVGSSADKVTVEFYDYTDKSTKELPANQIENFKFQTHKVGSEVQVLWQDKPYRAKILEVKDDFHLITYPGYPDYWNEWILSDRIVKGEVEVLWQGEWYKAVILQTKGEKTQIHYLGHDSSWDEWVTKDRLRTPAKPK